MQREKKKELIPNVLFNLLSYEMIQYVVESETIPNKSNFSSFQNYLINSFDISQRNHLYFSASF